MKKIYKIVSLFIILNIGLFSCSKIEQENYPVANEDGIPIILRNQNLPQNLEYKVYIFSKSDSDTDFALRDSLTLNPVGENRVKLSNYDLSNKQCKFFFIATPLSNNEIKFEKVTADTTKNWKNYRLKSKAISISGDNYYGILDMPGNSILGGQIIRGTLSRIVGQPLLNLYKMDTITNLPTNIEAGYGSILDRVYKIDIEYSGITSDIAFNDLNQPIDTTRWQNVYTETIYPDRDPSTLQVNLPQTQKKLETSDKGTTGSFKIKGIYCLPSVKSMKIKYTFYFDNTTPICGQQHTHDVNCFTNDSVILNVPKQGLENMRIVPNHFTVNSGAIKYNRIIDIEKITGLTMHTDWDLD